MGVGALCVRSVLKAVEMREINTWNKMNWLTGWGYCQMINLKYLENLAGNINLEAT